MSNKKTLNIDFSKIKDWRVAVVFMVFLLLGSGLGLINQLNVNVSLEAKVDVLIQMAEELNTTVAVLNQTLQQTINSTFYALQKPASYVISIVSSGGTDYTCMQNGTTGKLDWYSTNASLVINSALANLTSGRENKEIVTLKGNFTIDSPIQHRDNAILDLYGASIYLESGSNCDIINDGGLGIVNWEIWGGLLFGNRAGQSDGDAIHITMGSTLGDNTDKHQIIKDVVIDEAEDNGIYIDGNGTSHLVGISNCGLRACGEHALHLYHVVDSWVEYSDFAGDYTDVFIEFVSSTTLDSCYFGGSSADGGGDFQGANLLIDASKNIRVLNPTIADGGQHRIRIQKISSGVDPTHSIQIHGGRIEVDNFDVNNTYPAILIKNNAKNVSIRDVVFTYGSGNMSTYAVQETDTADYSKILDCEISSSDYGTGVFDLIGSNSYTDHYSPAPLVAQDQAIDVGVSDSYGDVYTLSPAIGFRYITMTDGCLRRNWGGSFSGDTVTLRMTVVQEDGTETEIIAFRTSTGSTYISTYELSTIPSDSPITNIKFDAKTDQASTSVTVSIRIYVNQH